ncbi:GGDEF domain-containing protein [Halothermothrix orenii]|uniref:Diguanylate cyclase n=1 Tax=Halothermothrix orenii (strain H 168 / OCM 544 / DSM 9562) TaxID=373903 RepID=B8D253_HALOH|nr:GGDEF domain-containing protein [Halothermothrix orenii]ACL69280.1 diguanylate cyclase [Halothermothrix orenii H 168]
MNNVIEKHKYYIIIAVFLIIIFLSYNSYQNTTNIIKSKYITHQTLIEKSIINSINNTNYAYQIAEKLLNDKMEKLSRQLISKYRDNPDVLTWDLEKIKQTHKYVNIYIIDNNLKIIHTTYKKDLGLDFNKYPLFSKVLRKRLEGDNFIVDRMDISIKSGQLKKYSYMPTPDHKYLIELSINLKEIFPQIDSINLISLTERLKSEYPTIEEINFYRITQQGNIVTESITLSESLLHTDIPDKIKSLVKKCASTSQVVSSKIKSNSQNRYYSVRFIPCLTQNPEDPYWWDSSVIGIKYNNEFMLEELNHYKHVFIINMTIITIVFVLFVLVIEYLLKETKYMAYHDHLTKLPNRALFERYFNKLKNNTINLNKMAVLFLDLDDFKNVNDTLGHAIGDKLLIQVAKRLKKNLKPSDTLSRLGGDEFTLLLTSIRTREDVIKFASDLSEDFKKPFILDGNKLTIHPSIGISIYPDNGKNLDSLLKQADNAMYQAKKQKLDFILWR